MKRIVLLAFLFLFVAMTPSSQQSKRVYITLDVSRSMEGDKYVLANYTTQMIVTLCDDDDEVHMILYGKEKCLSKEKKPLELIQKPIGDLNLPGSGFGTQFGDIIGFNQIYSPSKNMQDWLFIIGDGVWATQDVGFALERKKFEKTIKGGTLNVCYLQTEYTLESTTDFTQFVEPFGVVDIGKSDVNPETIIKGCDHFAKKILGFSEVSLKKSKSGSQCVCFKAELPIKEFILVYQDQVEPVSLPNVSNATADGTALNVKLKGTPTTIPVKTQPTEATLSGNVWRVKSGKVIPANTEIKVCFDKSIDLDKISIYPIVENVEFIGTCIAPVKTKMKKLKDNTFSICRDENTARVRVELSEESKENLPEAMLKKASVVVKANNKEYKAKYKDGGFECEIELINEETQYYAECDCPGHFKRVTPITTIVKGDCEPAKQELNVVEKNPIELPSMVFQELKIHPIKVTLIEEGTEETLNPKKFDIKVEVDNPFLYEDPKISFEGDVIVLDIHPKGKWCECFFPDTVKIKVVSTPKEGAFDDEGKQYSQTVFPVKFKLEKDRPWLSRCLWVLLTIAGLGLLLFYLWGLLKKNRFKKTGRIKERHLELNGSRWVMTDWKSGRLLREKGFVAWVKRWLVPFRDERHTLNWTTSPPHAGSITFVAAELKNKVYMTRESFNTTKMRMASFNPNNKNKLLKVDPISIFENGRCVGELKYDSGSKDDEKYYRIVLWILILADVLAIVSLITLMILSFR